MENTKKNIINSTLQRLISAMISEEKDEWPPKCSTILYQPERPQNVHDISIESQ